MLIQGQMPWRALARGADWLKSGPVLILAPRYLVSLAETVAGGRDFVYAV